MVDSSAASVSILWFLCFNAFVAHVRSSFDSNEDNNISPYPWLTKWKYYYPNLEVKLKDILQDRCLAEKIIIANNNVDSMWYFNKSVLPSLYNPQVTAVSLPISNEIQAWWTQIQAPKQMRVEHALCDAPIYKLRPYFNNSGCMNPVGYMSQSAPRCQIKYLKYICDHARMSTEDTTPNYFILPESNHQKADIPPTPYLLSGYDSFVTMCGQIVNSCGVIQATANCMAERQKYYMSDFKRKCPHTILNESHLKSEGSVFQCHERTPFSAEFTYIRRVFIAGEVDDTHVYHVHLEIIPRIIYHLKFLLENPDIKIMYGCDLSKTAKGTEEGLRKGVAAMTTFMSLAGIDASRLIVHKNVYAKQWFFPMEGGCQDPVYNTWMVSSILYMRELFMKKIGLNPMLQGRNRLSSSSSSSSSSSGSKPVMMLIKRSHGSSHTRNSRDLVRQWSESFTDRIIDALQTTFSDYKVVLFSDRNSTLMKCLACQIRMFEGTDVLIGMHGAGLANMLYMRPTGVVVEFAPYGNDGRCLLGGGPFSRLAAVMGHNYLMHHPLYGEYTWDLKNTVSEFNITRFVRHVKNFLISIR